MKNILYLFLVILFSCSSYDNIILITNSAQAQGSYYHIKYMSENGMDYQFQIDSIFLEIDSSLSIYKDYSLISKLKNGEDLKTDTLFNEVFLVAKKVFLATEGNFDCTVRPLVSAWGFYKNILGDSLVLDSARFRAILKDIGFSKLQLIDDSLVLPKGMSLDFNAIAQGFTVDVIGRFLESKNCNNYLIEVGGEILAKGKNADENIWRVGVDKPSENIDANERFQFILDLENKALATSGNYRKFYKKNGVKYSHTINPFTAFMVMGVRKTKQFAANNSDIEIYLVYTGKNGSWKTFVSPKMNKRIVN